MPKKCMLQRDGKTVRCQLRNPLDNMAFRKTKDGRTIWAKKRDLTHEQAKKLQKETGLPFCDGSGFPYVEGCYSDMSNWSGGPTPKQCIITNPATTNLAPYSIYTCGFLW